MFSLSEGRRLHRSPDAVGPDADSADDQERSEGEEQVRAEVVGPELGACLTPDRTVRTRSGRARDEQQGEERCHEREAVQNCPM